MPGEERETIEQLAFENGISPEQITVSVQKRGNTREVYNKATNPEPEKLKDREIKELYQRLFSLLNERVFNNELPPIKIDYTDQGMIEEDPEFYEDCLALFSYSDNGSEPPTIYLQVERGPDYGINKDDINELFHELIHYYCYLNRIEDTDLNHEYHNLEFKRITELFGGKCTYNDDTDGYNITELPDKIVKQIFKNI